VRIPLATIHGKASLGLPGVIFFEEPDFAVSVGRAATAKEEIFGSELIAAGSGVLETVATTILSSTKYFAAARLKS
jgi:hypothetical protein